MKREPFIAKGTREEWQKAISLFIAIVGAIIISHIFDKYGSPETGGYFLVAVIAMGFSIPLISMLISVIFFPKKEI